jgi:hypothetical protein
MKRLLIGFFMIVTVAAARADLVMRQQADFGGASNLVAITTRIHGDKIRQDITGLGDGDMSVIKDASTGSSIALMPRQKVFTRPDRRATHASGTDAVPAMPQETGKSDVVGGYETKLFAWAADRKLWSDTNGMIETLWVATNFPGFDQIKPELAKLDRANVSFPGRGMQPEISALPGMVVKSRLLVKMGNQVQPITILLLTARDEPVDPSIFDLPADYKEWNPAPSPGPPGSTPATNNHP